ncbi:flagellin structural protein [Escherichia coli]|nr:flagellin structural protein [Escherichia coli]CTW62773.1 flagellin structural protein [Escherichia coli]
MHSWKKKLVVSQLALACTLAITSQANATTYDTWTYYDNPTTALDWSNMDAPGTVDGNYVNYSGFGRCEQVPDMRSSYSSGAHPRGTS